MITIAYWGKRRKRIWEKELLASSGLANVEVLTGSNDTGSYAKFYNHVINVAKHDIIVFIDPNVNVQTQHWGKVLIDLFDKQNVGIISVFGSLGIPGSGCWWEDHDLLVGRVWYKEKSHIWETTYSEVMPGHMIHAVCAEGCFMAIDKNKIKTKFDERFQRHYFFDTDFSFTNHLLGVDIGITFDIEIVVGHIEYQKTLWEFSRRQFLEKYPQIPYKMTPEILLHEHDVEIHDGPKVSILIPTNKASLELFSSLESIYEKSTYCNREIIIIDQSGSREEQRKIKEFIKNHPDTRVLSFRKQHLPSVYNEIIMFHLAKDSEMILFSRDNIVLINDAISRMVHLLLDNRQICGTVGARLHFADNLVRHFGLQLVTMDTEEGLALGISHKGIKTCYGYQNGSVKNILGSSKDFLLISREVFAKIGGFNTNYEQGLEDCELNVRCILQGRINFLAGDAVCYHLEETLPTFRHQDYERLAHLIDNHFEELSPYFEQVYST